jgi:hypothetical protein
MTRHPLSRSSEPNPDADGITAAFTVRDPLPNARAVTM